MFPAILADTGMSVATVALPPVLRRANTPCNR
jgi:hypothetical protein